MESSEKAARKSVCDGLKDLFTLNWKSCEITEEERELFASLAVCVTR